VPVQSRAGSGTSLACSMGRQGVQGSRSNQAGVTSGLSGPGFEGAETGRISDASQSTSLRAPVLAHTIQNIPMEGNVWLTLPLCKSLPSCHASMSSPCVTSSHVRMVDPLVAATAGSFPVQVDL
jgi:hypothetical protein